MEPAAEKKSPFSFLKDAVLIVVSVALGYAAAQYADYRQERQLAEQAVKGIRDEVATNMAILEKLLPVHREWSKALSAADVAANGTPGINALFKTRPQLPEGSPSPFPFLRRSAWDAALAGGALQLLDFELVSALSDVYRTQEVTTQNINRLAEGALVQVEVYDPGKGPAAARLLWLTLTDIQASEEVLFALYEKNITLLDEAASQ